MIDGFIANVGDYIQTNPWLAIAAVFTGGALTATSPCVIVMIPLMMAFVAGRGEDRVGPGRAFAYSLVFVAGLSVAFTILGMIVALAGLLYGETPFWWRYVLTGVCVIMGLHLTGLLKIPLPGPTSVRPRASGFLGAFLIGALFGLVSTPCAAPVLVVLLTYLAGAKASVPFGAFLLLVYALGHSLLVLVAGTSMGAARRLVESRNLVRAGDILRRASGVVIILVGIYFAFH
ncbi:MAG: cytochrome c biogenesis protein CcdA [Candidatus Eisenbacteria bacterium]